MFKKRWKPNSDLMNHLEKVAFGSKLNQDDPQN